MFHSGDCTLIVTPKGKKILIDSGDNKSDILVPYLLNRKIRTLDYIVISHFDRDHCNGLIDVINKLKVKQIVISKQSEISEEFSNIMEIINKKNIPVRIVAKGDRIIVDKEVYIDVLYPENKLKYKDLNANSLVVKVYYKNFSTLFTGDIDEKAENNILKSKQNLKSTVVKIAHHGSLSSTTQEFLNKVNPQIALIGVGKNNMFGHPAKSILEKLNSNRYKSI